MKKPKSEETAELALLLLFAALEDSKTEIAALRLILERRGVTRKQLRQELREMQGSAVVKRRAVAAYRPIRKAALEALQSAANLQMLERVSAQAKIH